MLAGKNKFETPKELEEAQKPIKSDSSTPKPEASLASLRSHNSIEQYSFSLQQLTKCSVVNVNGGVKTYDVYIGRGKKKLGLGASKWGNPYEIGKDGTREEVISKHKAWLWKNKELLHNVFTELPGKTLGCHCLPEPCHGDVLLKLANSKFSCYYCINFQTDNEKEYSVHIITKHRPGTLAYPNRAAIKKFGLVPQKKPWET